MSRNKGWVPGVVVTWIACALAAVAAGCAAEEKRAAPAPMAEVRAPTAAAPAGEIVCADREAVVADIEKRLADPEARRTVDEFDRMILATDMAGEQLGRFQAAVAARAAKLKEWMDGPKGQKLAATKTALAEARKAGDAKKTEEVQAELDKLNAEHGEFRVQIRAEVMEVMTLAQQRTWAAGTLAGTMMRRFGRLDLTDAQKADIRKIAADQAAACVQEGTIRKDPYLSGLRRDGEAAVEKAADLVKSKVLTKEQVEKLQPKPAA